MAYGGARIENRAEFEMFLARLASNDPTLITLDLRRIYVLGDDWSEDMIAQTAFPVMDMFRLSQALRGNTHLQTLDLSSNAIRNIQPLADALRVNTTLLNLNLWENFIDDVGSAHMAAALRMNTTLTTLDLENNYITPEGAEHFVAALEVNTTLKYLRIDGNWGDVPNANDVLHHIEVLLARNDSRQNREIMSTAIAAINRGVVAQQLPFLPTEMLEYIASMNKRTPPRY